MVTVGRYDMGVDQVCHHDMANNVADPTGTKGWEIRRAFLSDAVQQLPFLMTARMAGPKSNPGPKYTDTTGVQLRD